MKKVTSQLKCCLSVAVITLCVGVVSGLAATFTVTNTNNSGAGSLRQAVLDANAAVSADTIVFDASFGVARTIILATEIRISDNFNTVDNLTITGPGANLLTISGNGVTFIFQTIQEDTTSISGMTLTNGLGNLGGTIQNSGILTLTNMVFTNNTASNRGGAIYNASGGTPTSGVLNVNNCTFTNNTANGDGAGAIWINSGVVTIADSMFSGNRSTGGGGAINNSGITVINNSTISNNTSAVAGNSSGGGGLRNSSDLTLNNCTVTGNTANQDSQGGGIRSFLKLTINNSVVSGNTATEGGGGIYITRPGTETEFLNITNSTISNNVANTGTSSTTFGQGGGIYQGNGTPMTITGSTVSGNTIRLGNGLYGDRQGVGGGIYSDGPMTLTNSTVSGNNAERSAGGIFDSHPGGSSPVIIRGSTIVNNTSPSVGGIRSQPPATGNQTPVIGNTIIANNTSDANPDVNGTFNSQGYNLIENTAGATIIGITTGNLTGVDPILGPLENNAGPTATHAPLFNSPVVDKGNSFAVATDQRQRLRPFDYPGIASAAGGDAADIGAVEMRPTGDVSGKVTTPTGLGLRNASIVLTDDQGVTRTATTSSFGAFSFVDVPTGRTYIIGVLSKRYRFASRSLNVNSDRINVDFVGLE